MPNPVELSPFSLQPQDEFPNAVELAKRKKLFRIRFLLCFFIGLSSLCLIYWNRFHLWEMIRYYQTPEPERSQRKAFADQMDTFQQQGKYTAMITAAAGWRKTHPADPNGYATEGFAAYYLGELDTSTAAWKKAAAMDPLIQESAVAWISAINEVKANWNGPLPALVLVDNDQRQSQDLWGQKALTLLQSGQYDEIEKTEAVLLKSPVTLADGRTTAAVFFEEMGQPADEEWDDAHWTPRLALIQKWSAARPHSRLAKLALASAWVTGAWISRGSDYNVTADGRDSLDVRLNQAKPILFDPNLHLENEPFYGTLFHQYAQLASIEGPAYDAVIDASLKNYPNDPEPVFSRASHLLPRWYGNKGDWEAATTKSADAIGGVQGDMLYARTVWHLESIFGIHDLWTDSDADWPRTQRGFEAILKRYPRSLSAANTYYVLAVDANDNLLARRILKTYLGGQVDRQCWKATAYFARSRMDVLRGS